VKNPKAIKLIDKILDELNRNGIIINTLVNDLQELRPYAIDEKQPVIAKAIRLTFEHVSEHETFEIPIPDDEPIQDLEVDYEMDQVEVENEPVKTKPKESLIYLISLMKDSENRLNLQEIREYNRAMIEFAG